MAYPAKTTQQLLRLLQSRLSLEGVDTTGRGDEVLAEALNTAARQITDAIVEVGRSLTTAWVTRSVALGDTTIALPDGSNPSEPRLLALTECYGRVGTGEPFGLLIDDARAATDNSALRGTGSGALQMVNSQLRFLAPAGAPAAMTVTIGYIAALDNVTPAAPTATPFVALPPEWTDVIVDLATALLIPYSNAAALRYEARGLAGLERQKVNSGYRLRSQVDYVRRVPYVRV